MKRLTTAAALLCLAGQAVAAPVDRATIIQKIVPSCETPTFLTRISCDCIVELLSTRLTATDIARAAEPGYLVANTSLVAVQVHCYKARATPVPP